MGDLAHMLRTEGEPAIARLAEAGKPTTVSSCKNHARMRAASFCLPATLFVERGLEFVSVCVSVFVLARPRGG